MNYYNEHMGWWIIPLIKVKILEPAILSRACYLLRPWQLSRQVFTWWPGLDSVAYIVHAPNSCRKCVTLSKQQSRPIMLSFWCVQRRTTFSTMLSYPWRTWNILAPPWQLCAAPSLILSVAKQKNEGRRMYTYLPYLRTMSVLAWSR